MEVIQWVVEGKASNWSIQFLQRQWLNFLLICGLEEIVKRNPAIHKKESS